MSRILLYFLGLLYSFLAVFMVADIFMCRYCTVLYCTVLYCTVLYCTVLYCTVLYIPKARERLLVKYGTQATMAGIYLDSVEILLCRYTYSVDSVDSIDSVDAGVYMSPKPRPVMTE